MFFRIKNKTIYAVLSPTKVDLILSLQLSNDGEENYI